MNIQNRLIAAFFAMLGVLLAGVLGYHFIEGWNLFDALYMTVITLATVGYGETNPLSPTGRMFTIFLIFGGIGLLTYAFSTFTAFLVEGELGEALRRRRMQKKIDSISNHYIVCGGGRTGSYIIDEFLKVKTPFVVIDLNPDEAAALSQRGVLVLTGDASHDDVLRQAGIDRARGLITCLPTDKDNMFVVVSAKGINPRLRVVAKSVDKGVREKFFRGGADSVVSPNFIGGLRMASGMLRPAVVSFLDTMLRDTESTLRVSEATVGGRAAGKTLEETVHRLGLDLVVLAVRAASGQDYAFNPKPKTRLVQDDVVVVMGPVDEVHKLQQALA
ncbi:MAG TPA: potassium channel protein [Elusimicrobiota bacterium]|nr:potassium channel protein [Elusimicrobiota bacterium]